MDINKIYNNLKEIICETLEIENNISITTSPITATKYNKITMSINIKVDSNIGVLPLVALVGHELFHAKQDEDNKLDVDMETYTNRYNEYKQDQWMMYYYYKIEREAQAFAWVLTGYFNDVLYENHERVDVYKHNKEIYQEMYKIVIHDQKLYDKSLETQELLNEEFREMKVKYTDILNEKRRDIEEWHKLITPHQ